MQNTETPNSSKAPKLPKEKRATSLYNFLAKKIDTLDWDGEWKQTFGCPPTTGIWYVAGHSGSGKTTFIVKLMKQFAVMGMKVRFYNFEEGDGSSTLQEIFLREDFESHKKKITIVSDFLPYEDIVAELKKTKAKVVVIDSRKEVGMTSKQVLELKRLFGDDMLLVIVCHVLPNGQPETGADRQVMQSARMKIFVDRFRAINRGRTFGEVEYFDIYKEKGELLWAEM